MSPIRHLTTTLALALLVSGTPTWAGEGHHGDHDPAMEKAGELVHHHKYDEAAKVYREIVDRNPENGRAWYMLGYSLHLGGKKDEALESYGKAAHFDAYRGVASYNAACVYATTDRKDQALEALAKAKHAGFCDLETIAKDPDLASVREDDRFPYPTRVEFNEMEYGHGRRLTFAVVVPDEMEEGRAYPVLIALPPGEQSRESVNWGVANYWGKAASARNWVVISPTAPEGGWFTEEGAKAMASILEGAHHHLNVAGKKFHLAGAGPGGAAAFHFAIEKPDLFQSLTVLSGSPKSHEDMERLDRLVNLPVHLFAGGADSKALRGIHRTRKTLKRLGVKTELKIFPNEKDVMYSLLDDGLMAFLDERCGMKGSEQAMARPASQRHD